MAYQGSVLGHTLSDWVVVTSVSATEVNAATVELEPTLLHSQFSEPGPHALLVRLTAGLGLEPHTDAVKERVVDIPDLYLLGRLAHSQVGQSGAHQGCRDHRPAGRHGPRATRCCPRSQGRSRPWAAGAPVLADSSVSTLMTPVPSCERTKTSSRRTVGSTCSNTSPTMPPTADPDPGLKSSPRALLLWGTSARTNPSVRSRVGSRTRTASRLARPDRRTRSHQARRGCHHPRAHRSRAR